MAVVLGAVISAVVAGAYTAQSLGYKVSRVDLLDPKSDYNKLWIDYIREFGEDDDAVVVVEGPTRERVVKVLEELSREVAQDGERFRSVLHEVDLSKIRAKGLHYLSPTDLAAIDQFIERTEPILAGGWTRAHRLLIEARPQPACRSRRWRRWNAIAKACWRASRPADAQPMPARVATSRRGRGCPNRSPPSVISPASISLRRTDSSDSCSCDSRRRRRALPARRPPPTNSAGSSSSLPPAMPT
jgi:hypothetical protein